MDENKIRDIVKNNDGLNLILNEIVNYEADKMIDEMIAVINDWKRHTNVISCETVIDMLKARKSPY